MLWTAFILVGFVAHALGGHNPCCSYPCENNGVCMTQGENYYCDCANLDFYGKHCEIPTFMKRIKLFFKPSHETLHRFLTSNKWFWTIINNVPFLANAVMRSIYVVRAAMLESPPPYTSEHDYITVEANFNYSVFTRALPPVPKECPTPMGVWGKKELPPAEEIVKAFFTRKEFLPEPIGTNLLFPFFAQHFTHTVFKTDLKKGPQFQWGNHGVDASNIYGEDRNSQNNLRSFKDGKLKVQIINDEEWPPLISEADVPMRYPKEIKKTNRFALGHSFFGLVPGLFMYSTIWLREHNRVCDILKKEHPEWNDERLFQTAKLVIVGETLKIVVEDYSNHLTNFNFPLFFKPELLFGQDFQYQNRISLEFNHVYHWHPLVPDEFNISGTIYNMKEFLYHPEIVVKHGLRDFVDSMIKQRAGLVGPRNHGRVTIPVVLDLLKHGRTLRMQSFNQYRKRFDMEPFKSFEELTGEKKFAKQLEDFYGDINAVEFYVGMMLEKRLRFDSLFSATVIQFVSPFSYKGLMTNPICSPKYWKPSTFGGEVGFNIIKTASLENLICKNIKGECPAVSFKVPDYVEGDVTEFVNQKLEL
nr:prostaglandin G/H synthase 2 [Crassostrea gigas]XP_034302669.1 prostaglandin G/H synthase 2 [Crassostrea gigas]XP_034302670.1 prostaglandin G/H synthase 2 [Crassostrea gigas]